MLFIIGLFVDDEEEDVTVVEAVYDSSSSSSSSNKEKSYSQRALDVLKLIDDNNYEKARGEVESIYSNGKNQLSVKGTCALAAAYAYLYEEYENSSYLNRFMELHKKAMAEDAHAARNAYDDMLMFGYDNIKMVYESAKSANSLESYYGW